MEPLLTWEDVLGSEHERGLIVETMVEFAEKLKEDKLFQIKWSGLNLRQRVNCLDWTKYLGARSFLSSPKVLEGFLSLKHCP